jgi:hypothetical protein
MKLVCTADELILLATVAASEIKGKQEDVGRKETAS